MRGWPRPHRGSPPTGQQERLLKFMKRFLIRNQRLPTHREMEKFLDSRGVHGVLDGLVVRGLVVRTGRKYVGYRLVGVKVVLVEEARA